MRFEYNVGKSTPGVVPAECAGQGFEDLVEAALSGMLKKLISSEVIALARRRNAPVLRSLDAIHPASALLLDADLMLAYDQRLLAAAQHNIKTPHATNATSRRTAMG